MYQKRATIYVLDCRKGLDVTLPGHEKTVFEEFRDVLLNILEQKALADRKTDLVGVILSSTKGTKNRMNDVQADHYQHITNLTGEQLKMPDINLIKTVANARASDNKAYDADILDAYILAIDAICIHCRRLRFEKRIVVFTDAEGAADWSDIDTVKGQIKNESISTTVVCSGLDEMEIKKEEEEEDKSRSLKAYNIQHWKQLLDTDAGDNIMSLADALAENMEFHTKQVRPTPAFRGYLTLGDPTQDLETSLSIDFHMYAKTYPQRPPTGKKWSALSEGPPSSSAGTKASHEVIMEMKYRKKPSGGTRTASENNNNNNDNTASTNTQGGEESMDVQQEQAEGEEIEPEALEKAFMFGKSIVTINSEIEAYLRLHTEPGMKILGFLSRDAVPRHYMISQVYVLVAGNHRPKFSGLALSALARALNEKYAVALVRHVSRQDVPPKLGILTPFFEPDIDMLYFVQVPFAEDIRQFTFSSLDQVVTNSGKVIKENHPLLPTDEMVDAMQKYVCDTDLMHLKQSGGSEYLKPEDTYNPVIWRFNKAITARAINPAAPIPELHPALKRQFEMVPELQEKEKEHIERMKTLFNVKKVPARKKKKGYGVTSEAEAERALPPVENVLQSQEERVKTETKDDQDTSYEAMMKSLMSQNIREISSVNPVNDFKAMVNNREEDLVTQAVERMCKMITHLVTTSFGDQYYGKAMDCLKVLRSTAANENESDTFNSYFHQLKKECKPGDPSSRRRDFWELLKKEKLSLITSDEAVDSNVSREAADKFLNETETEAEEPAVKPMDEDHVDTEDLLAMME